HLKRPTEKKLSHTSPVTLPSHAKLPIQTQSHPNLHTRKRLAPQPPSSHQTHDLHFQGSIFFLLSISG
ncbi:hypothetical protein COCCADRAFT_82604, partial [Bipolaris zeicola 26-R-13]